MRFIFLHSADKFSEKWLKRNDIKLDIIQEIFTRIAGRVKRSRRDYMYDIDIVVDEEYSSGYYFGINELHISSQACDYKSKNRKLKAFIANLLHEFRHWIQDNLLKIDSTELDYTTEDVEHSTPKYWNNVHEVDAREFEIEYLEKCYKLYKSLDEF